jgi:hypothetical protein
MARPIAFLIAALLLLPLDAEASEWGGIEPGVTTMAQVRQRYSPPVKETKTKVEGYDTVEWIYEGSRAPTGMIRVVVEFGLLVAGAYKADVVRAFRLDPKRWIFGQTTIVDGWGVPDRSWAEDDKVFFFYRDGLLVTFEKDGQNVLSMYFALPARNQPASGSPPPASPPSPAGGAPPRR